MFELRKKHGNSTEVYRPSESLVRAKILVTGGSGMVGTALRDELPEAIYLSSKNDLRVPNEADLVFAEHKPEYVIHLAAKVGGVKANMENLGDFYHDNIMINTNVLEAARRHRAKKVISLLSTCIYPDDPHYPLTEEQIHDGPPHDSNFAYAYAKRMLDVQSRAYRQQYGCDFITAVPNNLFGEHDNFDLENSHVIPAIIRKIYETKKQNSTVKLWGDGMPLREFTYAKDMARIIVFLLENYSGETPLNIGNTKEYSIKQVAEIIADILDYSGEIIWQDDMPSGQPKKPSDNSKLQNLCAIQYTDLQSALTNVCEWFVENHLKAKGTS